MSASNKTEAFRDPVCGMTVDNTTAKEKVEYAGSNYYFCCARCAERFRQAPDLFLRRQPSTQGLVVPGTTSPFATVSSAPPPAATADPDEVRRDPVCGMTVSTSGAHQHEYRGATYFFCCKECETKFKGNPEFYLSPSSKAADSPSGSQSSPSSVAYVCPMCEGVRDTRPGRARAAEWRLSPRCLSQLLFNTPVRCTLRSCARNLEVVRSVVWHSSAEP